jgi:UDP-GlcNAc:undecaprenyl-phosphate/decaprenyl-phosphate GlcNAc-1-phosphate transferase
MGMDECAMKYILLFATVLVCGAILILKAKNLGARAKSVDSSKRWAPTKPTHGGLLFALSVGLGQWLFQPLTIWPNLALIAAFGIGLFDDLYRIGPRQKLAGQCLAAICIMIHVHTLHDSWGMSLLFGFGTLVMMNSINMLDNMDGAATIGSLPFWLLSALVLAIGFTDDVLGALILVGALAFLMYNAHPSKMFMGDSGSMLLGAAAVLCLIMLTDVYATSWWTLLPLWAFISTLTLADTALVVIRRLQHGKSPMQGGKDHSTHHLVYHGWTQIQVTYVFLAMALFQSLCAFALVAANCRASWAMVSLCVYPVAWFIFIWRISNSNLKSGKFDYASH